MAILRLINKRAEEELNDLIPSMDRYRYKVMSCFGVGCNGELSRENTSALYGVVYDAVEDKIVFNFKDSNVHNAIKKVRRFIGSKRTIKVAVSNYEYGKSEIEPETPNQKKDRYSRSIKDRRSKMVIKRRKDLQKRIKTLEAS